MFSPPSKVLITQQQVDVISVPALARQHCTIAHHANCHLDGASPGALPKDLSPTTTSARHREADVLKGLIQTLLEQGATWKEQVFEAKKLVQENRKRREDELLEQRRQICHDGNNFEFDDPAEKIAALRHLSLELRRDNVFPTCCKPI